MKKLETIIHIHTPPKHVWDVLMDFDSYPEWNPFVRSIKGSGAEGENITITVQPPGKKGMDFTPLVLKSTELTEFRWKGKLFIKGLFDGEHYFVLKELPNGSTALYHGEIFSGLLIPFCKSMLDDVKSGFEHMNIALKERCEQRPAI
ncbi:MAG: SRPBCC domain-containing protein [Balneolaceae bacterium]|nr:SRPBCC domain-containing protein [Balneolaceae bacterium]MCH8550003.1 SRPBCC domain-containing protein [Balneolaceae bacterium]